MSPDRRQILATLETLAAKYPDSALREEQMQDVPRIAFHIETVLRSVRAGASAPAVCDIGGGIGLFSVGCAALGMKATLVDDFCDEINRQYEKLVLDLHGAHGVSIVACDVVAGDLPLPNHSFDAVTSFHSMEHWHHSPRRMFHQVLDILKPQGLFFLAVPNCVNLRKRIFVPLGRGSWSSMHDWYDSPVFRGHVREPSISDLEYIARDLNLARYRIFGRNWLGFISRYWWVRALTPLADRMLRLAPGLCSDIYLSGYKPGS